MGYDYSQLASYGGGGGSGGGGGGPVSSSASSSLSFGDQGKSGPVNLAIVAIAAALVIVALLIFKK